MPKFFTYRKNVKLLPGQVIRFVKGKGYFAFGKVVRPKPKPKPAVEITMFDSVDIGQIPEKSAAVAGYVGGHWPTYPELVKRFPTAHKLSIAINSREDADVLDVEQGDAVNADAPAWVKRQLARGVKRPVVYTSLANANALLYELNRGGVSRSQVRLWTAHYTHKAHRCSASCGFGFAGEADATQYDDHALGKNLDASLCSPTFFRADV